MKIFPSLISADLLSLGSVIRKLEPHCDGFHLDIMDNHFVPNLTWGSMFIKAIAHATERPVFIHLMIDKPEEFLDNIHIKDASTVSFHVENTKNILQTIKQIRENKWHANIAIKPNTPLEKILPFLNDISSVLLMSVEPGFSGQRFLKKSIDRLKELAKYRNQKNFNFSIVMDGGINSNNISELADNGCDEIAVASALFDSPDSVIALEKLYEAAQQ